MDDRDNVRQTVDHMAGDIGEYLQNVAGVGCPPECPHFSPTSSEACAAGCQLKNLHPWDCLEANVHDLSRYLVGCGWKQPDGTAVVFSTSGE